MHASSLKEANNNIEAEFDSFIKADDSVVHTLQERDSKYSPSRGALSMSSRDMHLQSTRF